jgi:hypothetical protein
MFHSIFTTIPNENIEKIPSDNFGFIIIRYVNSPETSHYWKYNIQQIRKYYSNPTIVIIDDNSSQKIIKDDPYPCDLDNVVVIHSELPGKGELLGFYYLHKLKLFKKAVVIHDSFFFHGKIDFNSIIDPCKFLWDFPGGHYENDSIHGLSYFKKIDSLADLFNKKQLIRGCFGCQAFVTWDFLEKINEEYDFFNILNYIKSRHERCNVERLFGLVCIHALIHCYGYNKTVGDDISILGNINDYPNWGISWQSYYEVFDLFNSSNIFLDQHGNDAVAVKVFSGR